MVLKNTRSRYGSVAMTLHWVIAMFVLINLSLGLYMADLPKSDINRYTLFQVHKSFGLTVLVLSLARLGWRLVNPVPPAPKGLHPLLGLGARGAHVLLYVLIIAIPLAGWAMVSSSSLGLPTPYFFLFSWPNISFLANVPPVAKAANFEFFKGTHEFLADSAIALIALHVLAALYHQFLRRDDVLRRMMPGTDVSEPA